MSKLVCTKCGSDNVATERRINGNHVCQECGFTWKIGNLAKHDCKCSKQKPIEIKWVKTHPDAKLPVKNHESDTGYDVFSIEDVVISAHSTETVNVGLKVGYITEGYWFEARSRSGLGFKHGITAFNGTIDCGYRGNLGVLLINNTDDDHIVHKGDRVVQIAVMPVYQAEMSFVDEVIETIRGENGFGSSGK